MARQKKPVHRKCKIIVNGRIRVPFYSLQVMP